MGRDGQQHVLTMFDEVVHKVIDGVSGGLVMKLLRMSTLKLYFDKRDIVFLV